MARGRYTPTHNLRRNEAEWSPAHVGVIDTETRTTDRPDSELLTMHLWCATVRDRRPVNGRQRPDETGTGHDRTSLAAWVDRAAVGRKHLWLYAHNAGFDLATTQLPIQLTELGWTITDYAVHTAAPWFRLRRGSKRIVLADSWSVFPRPLRELGRAVGIAKPDLPASDADDDLWGERCRADVDIALAALCEAMDWWDAQNLGQWSITGPSTGWHAYRHIPTAQAPVIVPDKPGIAADREAVYSGRRGQWRVGTFTNGPFLELDFTAAYPMVAAFEPLPARRLFTVTGAELDERLIDSPAFGVIAECVIDTDEPLFPVRLEGRTWYPVGRFVTTLASPDIIEARRLGHLKEIRSATVHRLSPHMQSWARWLLNLQYRNAHDTPETVRIMAKLWGRSVIGRWASRGSETEDWGDAPNPGWHIEQIWDVDKQCHGWLVDMAGKRRKILMTGDTDDTYPAVLAFVESHVRVRLGRAIRAIGEGAILQCNTDGMIVNANTLGTRSARGDLVAPDGMPRSARVAWCLERLQELTDPLRLRVKATHRSVTVLGPQHVQLPNERKFSGIPAIAQQLSADELRQLPASRRARSVAWEDPNAIAYKVKNWPGLAWQLEYGDGAGYVRPETTPVISGVLAPGWVARGGYVIPIETEILPDGTNGIVSWFRSFVGSVAGNVLEDVQNDILEAYQW